MLKPDVIPTGEAIPLAGYAQVGTSGLSGVQTSLIPLGMAWPDDDPDFTNAKWVDAHVLPPPDNLGGNLPDEKLPPNLHQFDAETGKPNSWPLRLTMAHRGTVLAPEDPGEYILRCSSIDDMGYAQSMPRPLCKSGRNAIEEVNISVV